MHTLIFSRMDQLGGAARAAFRLHKSLQINGVKSNMLVETKTAAFPGVISIESPRTFCTATQQLFGARLQQNYVDAARTDLSNSLFSLGLPGYDLAGGAVVRQADILNFHWVTGMLSSQSLAALFALGKPTVWTLHDEWPYTGGCHYSAGCDGFETACNPCKQLRHDPRHLPEKLLAERAAILTDKNITVVTPSRWLAGQAAKSRVFRHKRIEVIPNTLETDIFSPIEKRIAKERLGLPLDCCAILFAADSGREKRKGFSELSAAMKHLSHRIITDNEKIIIMIFGEQANNIELPYPVKSLGYLREDKDLALAYSAADILALPSLEDNYPNIMTEAMACGTPVVAFDVGGMRDLISPKLGLVVPPFDTQAFGKAIARLCLDAPLRQKYARECLSHMRKTHGLKTMGAAYKALFKELIFENRGKFPRANPPAYNTRTISEHLLRREQLMSPGSLFYAWSFALLRGLARKVPWLKALYRKLFMSEGRRST